MTQQELAGVARVDIKTIGNLESRGVWPIARTRGRIEAALGWEPGALARIAAEAEGESQPPSALLDERLGEDAEVIRTLLRDMLPEQAEAVLAGLEERLRQRASGHG